MGIVSGLINACTNMVRNKRKAQIYNFIDLETPVTKTTLLTKGGSLLSVFEYHGLNHLDGDQECERLCSELSEYLGTVFGSGGHTLSIVNDVDDSKTEQFIEQAVEGQRRTAKALQLNIQDVLDSNVKELSKFVIYDRIFIALWTHSSAIPAKELELIQKERNKLYADFVKNTEARTTIRDTINPIGFMPELLDRHEAAVGMLANALDRAKTRAEILTARQVARELRLQIESSVPFNWDLFILGDEYLPRAQDGNSKVEEENDLLPPRFDRQITRQAHEEIDGKTWQVGERFYSSLYVDLYPKRLRPYSQLKKIIPKDIPYRINITMNSGAPLRQSINAILGNFVFWGHDENKLIRQANEHMEAIYRNAEDVPSQMQMVIVTHATNQKDLKRNRELLHSAFAEWGRASLVQDVSDPRELYIASSIGASPRLPVEAGVPPVSDAAFMMPLYRVTSQWNAGAVLFANNKGQLMPFQPASNIQEAYSTAMIARPRQGKSVLANAILQGLCIKPGIQSLPRIVALDIGASSEGVIDQLHDSLPMDQRHWAVKLTWQQNEDYSVNILDLPLGAERPLPFQIGVVRRILLMMVSDPGVQPREGMSDLVTAVISEAYDNISKADHIKKYTPGINTDLDAALRKHEITAIPNETTYKSLRDRFFKKNLIKEAVIAQSMHVPSVGELPEVAASSEILQREYGKNSGFKILDLFVTKLRQSLRRYPSLSGVSKIDLSSARVIMIDLTQVAPKGEEGEALKDTSIMYSVAAYRAAGDFYQGIEHVHFFEEMYQDYQRDKANKLAEDDKLIQFDELHRPAASPSCVALIEQFLLEGPKYKVGIHLISQEVKHFRNLLSNCTNIFFLGEPSKTEVEAIHNQIGLSESERHALTSGQLHGPKPGGGGSALLHRTVTRDGTYSQILRFPYGPVGLWGLNTSGDDRKLRRMMVERFGGENGRRYLAEYFPMSTIKDEVELRRNKRAYLGDEDEAIQETLVEEIFNDLVKKIQTPNQDQQKAQN